jgi:CheY-like chemotaxis protein
MEAKSQGGKILVIDDLADWRDMMGGLLREAGYEVQSAGDADEAMRLLRQGPYHVAVVDIRLDEQDEHNREGLALAARMKEYFPELAILILSGYADIPAVKYALQPRDNGLRIAFDFLEKHEISKLLPSIENAFANAARVNPRLEIEPGEAWSWSRLQDDLDCLQPLSPEAARGEITDLLQRIFHPAERIHVRPMRDGHSSAAVILVTPVMRGIAQTDVVVKFNERQKAERESGNYDTYVENYVGGARRTQRLDYRATARLGGIAYSFVGAEATDFQRFSQAYARHGTSAMQGILDNLFKETCYNWYTSTLRDDPRPRSLSAGYKEWLRLSAPRLASALNDIVGRGEGGLLAWRDPHLPGQLPIILEERGVELANPLPLSQSAFAYTGPYCFTHGDLHEGNILVDSHDQTWLIDFYHTGESHPVRDFAMLESAIKLSLQRSDCPVAVLYDWERGLLHAGGLTQAPAWDPPLRLDAELDKATRLIRHTRALLLDVLPGMTMRDYQISLYFHALKAMTLGRKLDARQRLHALICAALLAEVLQ